MSYGLIKASNYYNRIEAWRDWQRLAAQCDPYIVALFQPPANAGWRTIDKCSAWLRAATRKD